MKIAVMLVIEVSYPDQWTEAFGVGGSAAVIREDVKDYVLNLVQQAAVWDEVDAQVSRK